MSFRIAINGLGRIGRCVLRAFYESKHYSGSDSGSEINSTLEIVALNELADTKTLAHLLRFDSTHGRFPGEISSQGDLIRINDDTIPVTHVEALEQLPWSEVGVDLVLECTGTFTERNRAQVHLQQGADKVLFSQPAESDIDATIVYGVNNKDLKPEHRIISSASCTTNCIIPVIQCLDEALGIDSGSITTIHSAMNDQPVIDAFHHTDLRKTRSAFQSIIPVETGLAKGIDRILPKLSGRFQAHALRVPVMNVSAIDLTVVVKKGVTPEEVNAIIRSASEMLLPNVLSYTDEPLASCDFNHDLRSSIVDMGQTRVSGKHLVKLLVWFDNEWAYANRMLDVVKLIQNCH